MVAPNIDELKADLQERLEQAERSSAKLDKAEIIAKSPEEFQKVKDNPEKYTAEFDYRFIFNTSDKPYIALVTKYLSQQIDKIRKENKDIPKYAPVIVDKKEDIDKLAAFFIQLDLIADKQKSTGSKKELEFNLIMSSGHASPVSIRVVDGKIKIFHFDSILVGYNEDILKLAYDKYPDLQTKLTNSKFETYNLTGKYIPDLKNGDLSSEILIKKQPNLQVTKGCGEYAMAFLKYMNMCSTSELQKIATEKDFKALPAHFVKLAESESSFEYGVEGKEDYPSNPLTNGKKTIGGFKKENTQRVVTLRGKTTIFNYNVAILNKAKKHIEKALDMIKDKTQRDLDQIIDDASDFKRLLSSAVSKEEIQEQLDIEIDRINEECRLLGKVPTPLLDSVLLTLQIYDDLNIDKLFEHKKLMQEYFATNLETKLFTLSNKLVNNKIIAKLTNNFDQDSTESFLKLTSKDNSNTLRIILSALDAEKPEILKAILPSFDSTMFNILLSISINSPNNPVYIDYLMKNEKLGEIFNDPKSNPDFIKSILSSLDHVNPNALQKMLTTFDASLLNTLLNITENSPNRVKYLAALFELSDDKTFEEKKLTTTFILNEISNNPELLNSIIRPGEDPLKRLSQLKIDVQQDKTTSILKTLAQIKERGLVTEGQILEKFSKSQYNHTELNKLLSQDNSEDKLDKFYSTLSELGESIAIKYTIDIMFKYHSSLMYDDLKDLMDLPKYIDFLINQKPEILNKTILKMNDREIPVVFELLTSKLLTSSLLPENDKLSILSKLYKNLNPQAKAKMLASVKTYDHPLHIVERFEKIDADEKLTKSINLEDTLDIKKITKRFDGLGSNPGNTVKHDNNTKPKGKGKGKGNTELHF